MSTQETEHDVPHFNNENLNVSVSKLPNCFVKFDIKVTPQGTEAAYQKAVKSINKEVIIPGFRKGRAPDHMIKEKYQGAIEKEFIDIVMQTGFNEAIHLTSIHPLKDGIIKRPVVHECSREKGAHFVIEFETRPQIPSVIIDDLKLEQIAPAEIKDIERENALEQVLLQFTTYEPLDRPVEENDFVDVSVELLESPPREIIHNQRTQVNSKGLPSWMRNKVLGLKPGESAEGMTNQDPNLSEPNPDFESAPFRITVNSIWQGTKPSVDDELAKRVGLNTVAELHEKINERLEHQVQEDVYKQTIQALEELLIEKYPFDIPQTYIDSNKENQINAYLDNLEKQGFEFDEENFPQIEKMIEKNTIRNLQLFFLYNKIAIENQIKLSEDDITQELTRQLALMASGRSEINLSDNKEALREHLHQLANDRKIKQFLIGRATANN